MGLFIQQNDQRSQLQAKLAAELLERAKQRAVSASQPDGVDDSRYIEGTAHAGRLTWIWIVAAIIVIVGFLFFVLLNFSKN